LEITYASSSASPGKHRDVAACFYERFVARSTTRGEKETNFLATRSLEHEGGANAGSIFSELAQKDLAFAYLPIMREALERIPAIRQ